MNSTKPEPQILYNGEKCLLQGQGICAGHIYDWSWNKAFQLALCGSHGNLTLPALEFHPRPNS